MLVLINSGILGSAVLEPSMQPLFYNKSFPISKMNKWLAGRYELCLEFWCITYCITVLSSPSGNNNNESRGKRNQGMIKSVLSLGNPEAAFSPPKFDYGQPFVS